jgi:hypothetical protein
MARRRTPKWQQRGGKTGYQAQDGSRAYNDRLRQQGVMDNNPAGTAYVMGSNSLGYGVGAAYSADGTFLGFVRANLNDGVRVNYNPDGSASGIQMPGQAPMPAQPAPPPAPPAFNGYTPDSFYNDALATIAANRQRALDAATEGERSLANDFGLGITQDDTGARFTGQWAASDASRGGIDPSNPFSRASLLNKSYFVAGRMGEGSYANRGLLTSGAYQRNQQRDAFRFEAGKDQLLKQFASGLQGYRQRRADAQSQYDTNRNQASLDLYGRNRDNYDRMYPA